MIGWGGRSRDMTLLKTLHPELESIQHVISCLLDALTLNGVAGVQRLDRASPRQFLFAPSHFPDGVS